MSKIHILGAGITGISTAYHLGHANCLVYEKDYHPGGHIHTEFLDGFTWDDGPHMSFTRHEQVKNLFAENVEGEYLEYPVETGNYFYGNWIPHPAQSNLFAVPQPLREKCLNDFLETRRQTSDRTPRNYREWLYLAFGKSFAETFPSVYTRKYWTVDPVDLTTDWVGERVYFPSVEDVTNGAKGPLERQTHYIKAVRYPKTGGYFAYAKKMVSDTTTRYNHELTHISFKDKELFFNTGRRVNFEKLVITLPLPVIIRLSDAPGEVQEAANRLSCTSLLIVNVTASHPTARPENWFYIYDKDKYTTRINCTEKLSPHNAPEGKSGIQVEVYFSKFKPISESATHIARKVCQELVEMGVVRSADQIESTHTKWVPFANVIFDHPYREALDTILTWLEKYGLVREDDDLDPITDWDKKFLAIKPVPRQAIFLAGRYGQWKYYWSDDCVLRGQILAKMLL